MVNKAIYVNGTTVKSTKLNIQTMQHLSVACGLVCAMTKGHAVSFEVNPDWKLETNTSLSLGASWSMQDPSAALMFKPDADKIGRSGNGIDVNGDDGRMNFAKHDRISQIIKGFTEIKLNGGAQGAVLSSKYWYDHAYETGNGDLKTFDDAAWPRLAKFKGIDLWDAYIWKDFTLSNGQTLNAKFGKHSLNWGKSQFFQNGLNSVSAFDFAAMNRPGGDVRERIIPVEMFSFSAGVNDTLKVEAFYQFKARPSVLDGCGTFFAISDIFPENCGPLLVAGAGSSDAAIERNSFLPRTASQKAKNGGEYGIALKQTVPWLNNAEWGVYFANYHSRLSHFDGTSVTAPGPANFNTATIFSVYPEDIKMYGMSLSGKVGSTMISAELNHKPNMPLHFNSTDMVYSQVRFDDTPFTPPKQQLGFNELVNGYVRLPVTQFSIAATDRFSNVLGAESMSLHAELGVNHIANIGNHRIGRSGAFGRSELSTGAYNPETHEFQCTTYGSGSLSNEEVDRINARYCNRKGFYSDWSLGYRVHAALNYNDLVPSTVITPSLMFRHDVHGYGPNFQEGQMGIAAGLSATYQKKYTAELAYNTFFGSNDFSVLDDRDFASFVFKAKF